MSSQVSSLELKLVSSSGWRAMVALKLLAALVGAAWLIQLASRLSSDQLGVYFGVLALVELTHHVSSLGVTSYCDRYLPADWVQAPRAAFRRRLLFVLVWRLATLAFAAATFYLSMPLIADALGWVEPTPFPSILFWYVLTEGLLRFFEVILTATLHQSACQVLVFARGLGRLAFVLFLDAPSVLAVDVLLIDIVVTAVCIAGSIPLLVRLSSRVPAAPAPMAQPFAGRLSFTWRSYAALLLERTSNIDVIKLVVSGVLGPTALATFGLAHALVDYASRYMPLAMFHGHIRAWLTVRYEQGAPMSRIQSEASFLARINLAFVAAASPALALFGEAMLRSMNASGDLAQMTTLLVALAPLSFVLTARICLTIFAHLHKDGHALLRASAMTVLAPLLVFWMSPTMGLAGVLAGCWWLELGPCFVLLWYRGRGTLAWSDGWRCMSRILLSAGAAAVIGAIGLATFDGRWSIWLSLMLYLVTYIAMLGVLRPFPLAEFERIRSEVRR